MRIVPFIVIAATAACITVSSVVLFIGALALLLKVMGVSCG